MTESEGFVSRSLRLGIGLVSLIPVMGATGGLLVAAGVEGWSVGWLTLAVGLVWFGFVIWWVLRAPAPEGRAERRLGPFRDVRFK